LSHRIPTLLYIITTTTITTNITTTITTNITTTITTNKYPLGADILYTNTHERILMKLVVVHRRNQKINGDISNMTDESSHPLRT